jgi:hypothetical protein
MRLILQNGQEYRIHFQHLHCDGLTIDEHEFDCHAPHWITTASAHADPCPTKERPCGALVSEGIAYCSPVDHFNKSVGRKKALARAIKTLPREIRAQIWTAYFQVVPK